MLDSRPTSTEAQKPGPANEVFDCFAFYLPQFHPIAENNNWWGPGFSEWRNVAKARRLFPGHQQPLLPGALGFYDLRLRDTHQAQVELADSAGITGFCFYHYWFSGKKLLETPIELFRDNKDLNLKYCLSWANHSWTGHWAGRSDDILIAQDYPGPDDDFAHYCYLREFFKDSRYYRRSGKPVFLVFRPESIPDIEGFCKRMNNFARDDGESGLFLIAQHSDRRFLDVGFDAIAPHTFNEAVKSMLVGWPKFVEKLKSTLLRYPKWTLDYQSFAQHCGNRQLDGIVEIPTAIPNWDNTPRVGRRGLVLVNTSPDKYFDHLLDSTIQFRRTRCTAKRLLFIKSWNEWAEGNHLEPDIFFGNGWIEATRRFVDSFGST